MTDPQIQALAAQIQANTAQIQNDSNARVVADDALNNRVGSLEAALTELVKQVIRTELMAGGLLHQSR